MEADQFKAFRVGMYALGLMVSPRGKKLGFRNDPRLQQV